MKYSYIVHDAYGCESGCCGHAMYLYEDEKEVDSSWTFSHPQKMSNEEFGMTQLKQQWPTVEPRIDLFQISND